jgi:hypothetical protein
MGTPDGSLLDDVTFVCVSFFILYVSEYLCCRRSFGPAEQLVIAGL